MASPKISVFALFDGSGAPLTGVVPTFATYKDTSGGSPALPTITEIGGGLYQFTPVFPTDKGITLMINGTASANPQYQWGFLRPEDFATDDNVVQLRRLAEGRWKIYNTGPDANRLVLYSSDGVTVLQKWDLKDVNGNPVSTANAFERVPVNTIP